MSTLNRSQSNHHLMHLPLDEANIIVTKQDLQRQVRSLYKLIEEDADEKLIKEQKNVIRSTELVLKRLQQNYASTVS